MRNKPRRGFSLIELLSVVVLLGIMAAMAFPLNNALLTKPSGNQITNDMDTILSAALDFRYDVGLFPDDAPAGQDPGLTANLRPGGGTYPNWNGPYFFQYPTPPTGFTPYKWNNKSSTTGEVSVGSTSGSTTTTVYLVCPTGVTCP